MEHFKCQLYQSDSRRFVPFRVTNIRLSARHRGHLGVSPVLLSLPFYRADPTVAWTVSQD